jgi:hypothetical protein
MRGAFDDMRKHTAPIDVLGGTIYLFDYNPSADATK